MALLAGSYFMERLRKEILDRTKYHCSAGISHNKMLAKLIAGRHKPKAQTVLPRSEVITFLDREDITGVRMYGGKFGKAIVKHLKITVC
jgi:DNA polymerase eta